MLHPAILTTKGSCEPLSPCSAPTVPALDRWHAETPRPQIPTHLLPVAVLASTIN
jgi:hypothetical protein